MVRSSENETMKVETGIGETVEKENLCMAMPSVLKSIAGASPL